MQATLGAKHTRNFNWVKRKLNLCFSSANREMPEKRTAAVSRLQHSEQSFLRPQSKSSYCRLHRNRITQCPISSDWRKSQMIKLEASAPIQGIFDHSAYELIRGSYIRNEEGIAELLYLLPGKDNYHPSLLESSKIRLGPVTSANSAVLY